MAREREPLVARFEVALSLARRGMDARGCLDHAGLLAPLLRGELETEKRAGPEQPTRSRFKVATGERTTELQPQGQSTGARGGRQAGLFRRHRAAASSMNAA